MGNSKKQRTIDYQREVLNCTCDHEIQEQIHWHNFKILVGQGVIGELKEGESCE